MQWTRLVAMHWPHLPWLKTAGDATDAAEEIRAVRGMRSEEALGLLPGGSTEVIHRDRFAPVVR
jgi:hypothetical protein